MSNGELDPPPPLLQAALAFDDAAAATAAAKLAFVGVVPRDEPRFMGETARRLYGSYLSSPVVLRFERRAPEPAAPSTRGEVSRSMPDAAPARRQVARSPANTPLLAPPDEPVEALGDHLCALALSLKPIHSALFLRRGSEPAPPGVAVAEAEPKLVDSVVLLAAALPLTPFTWPEASLAAAGLARPAVLEDEAASGIAFEE